MQLSTSKWLVTLKNSPMVISPSVMGAGVKNTIRAVKMAMPMAANGVKRVEIWLLRMVSHNSEPMAVPTENTVRKSI